MKSKIRIGFKRETLFFPNAGVFVVSLDAAAATMVVAALSKLRAELDKAGYPDVAKMIVGEFR